MKYGFDDYIVKPVTKENVKPILEKLLNKYWKEDNNDT